MARRLLQVLGMSGCALAATGCGTEPDAPPVPILSSGHFDLELVGVPRNKQLRMAEVASPRLYVELSGLSTVKVTAGPLAVVDADGTDGPAALTLPSLNSSRDTAYAVYARVPPGAERVRLGGPCIEDDGETFCSLESTVQVPPPGERGLRSISKQLLFLSADVDGDGAPERAPLFDDAMAEALWRFEPNGLRLAQLRFFEADCAVN